MQTTRLRSGRPTSDQAVALEGEPILLTVLPVSTRFPLIPTSAILVPASAGSMLAQFPPVPAGCLCSCSSRCRLGADSVPASAGWLDSRQCWLSACLVLASAGSVPAWFPPVLSRCQLGSRLCWLGFRQCQLGSRAFLVCPDQMSSILKGSFSIDSPQLRLHPSDAFISGHPPLLQTLHLCLILVQLLQGC